MKRATEVEEEGKRLCPQNESLWCNLGVIDYNDAILYKEEKPLFRGSPFALKPPYLDDLNLSTITKELWFYRDFSVRAEIVTNKQLKVTSDID